MSILKALFPEIRQRRGWQRLINWYRFDRAIDSAGKGPNGIAMIGFGANATGFIASDSV
jgi:hypothetical protein